MGNDRAQVIAMTQRLTQLMIERNIAELDEIIAADFTLTHITGYVQPKAEWFSEIESERMKYYSAQEVKTVVELDGEEATVVVQHLLDARIWGSRNAWRLQQTMKLEKRNGKWIILKSVAKTF